MFFASVMAPQSSQIAIDLDSVRDKNYLTHNLHPYPAKFIPQIPARILDTFSKAGSIVVDPFCGSGTVAVEAALRGCSCFASDVNPIATLVTRAKVARLTERDSSLLIDLLIRLRRGLCKSSLPMPEFRNMWHWFTKEMAQELNGIRSAILEMPNDSAARQVALAAFSAIIVKCSNQDSDTRWVAVEKVLVPGTALSQFEAKLLDAHERLLSLASLAKGAVHVSESDARRLEHLANESADIVVTSPPYLNSYDYYLYHKLRMFWLGFDHYAVQAAEIGSRNKHCDNEAAVDDYFSAMEGAFVEMRRILISGGIAALVVGDSIYRGELVDMKEKYTQLGSRTGFVLVDCFSFDQRRYTSAFNRSFKSKPKQSHILVFARS